jgi:hypothetical protein
LPDRAARRARADQSQVFHLPGKQALRAAAQQFAIVVVDASEMPIERPKKQRGCFIGKKRRHTLKAQFVIDRQRKQVICTAHGRGREHNFKLFKRSQMCFSEATECLGERGYQGLQKLPANSQTPKKQLC